MNRLALFGSLDPDTTAIYWEVINREIRQELGHLATASAIWHHHNGAELEALLSEGDWEGLGGLAAAAARSMADSGAQGLVLCGSPLNPLCGPVGRASGLYPICMVRAMAETIRRFRIHRVAALGIRLPREHKTWCDKLSPIKLVPTTAAETEWINEFAATFAPADEFSPSLLIEASRIASSLRSRGAQALVLASPRLQRLFPDTVDGPMVPVFDAVEIHARAAAVWALKGRRTAPRSSLATAAR